MRRKWIVWAPFAILGILLFVAFNMVKPAELREVWQHNRFHAGLMVYTAVMVAVTDFLIGVLSALVLFGILHRFLDRPRPPSKPTEVERPQPVPVPLAAAAAQGAGAWRTSS